MTIYLGSGSELKKQATKAFFFNTEVISVKTNSLINQPKGLEEAYEAAAGRIQEILDTGPPPGSTLVALEGYVDRAYDFLPWMTGTLAIVKGPTYNKIGVSTLLQLPLEVSQQIDDGKELGLCTYKGVVADKTIIIEDLIFGHATRYISFTQALISAEKVVN